MRSAPLPPPPPSGVCAGRGTHAVRARSLRLSRPPATPPHATAPQGRGTRSRAPPKRGLGRKRGWGGLCRAWHNRRKAAPPRERALPTPPDPLHPPLRAGTGGGCAGETGTKRTPSVQPTAGTAVQPQRRTVFSLLWLVGGRPHCKFPRLTTPRRTASAQKREEKTLAWLAGRRGPLLICPPSARRLQASWAGGAPPS